MGKSSKKKKKSPKLRAGKVKEPDYIIYTDGGCAINPGGPGGYGAIVIDNSSGEVFEFSGGFASTTNNRMEIMAAIVALESIPTGRTAKLYSDSQYFINCFSGVWTRNLNTDLFQRADEAAAGKKIELDWVRGHSGNPYNEMCDRMATEAMSQQSLPIDAGYSGVKKSFRAKAPTLSSTGGAMGVIIKVPKMMEAEIDRVNQHQYAQRYHVNPSCANAILTFAAKSGKRFKDYASLKTGGIDYWSRKSVPAIIEECPAAKYAYPVVEKYFTDSKDIASAIKWFARGLPLEDSIRKVLVDIEVSQNIAWRV